jgi:predicted HTH domain antitoxin
MAKTKVVPLRLPEKLDQLASLSAQREHTNKATALRQWLYEGAALYALRLASEGRISVGYAAELLELPIYELYNLAEERGIELGATLEQYRRSRDVLDRLSRASKATASPISSRRRGADRNAGAGEEQDDVDHG